jgi:hypothetical protein
MICMSQCGVKEPLRFSGMVIVHCGRVVSKIRGRGARGFDSRMLWISVTGSRLERGACWECEDVWCERGCLVRLDAEWRVH